MARANQFDVVVLGGANWDCLIKGPALPKPGETVEGREFLSAPGGKGANQAVAAARLGARVAFIGCLGRDECGEQLLENLRPEKVDTRVIFRTQAEPTGRG